MMNNTSIQQTLADVEALYKATMELYQSFFQMLEAAINRTPDTDIEKLSQLNALAKEAQEALQADIALFDNALASDHEALNKLNEELKIQSIYEQLKQS